MASAARLADGLGVSAERIPVAVEDVQMSVADRAGFQAEAATLRSQARALAAAARSNDPDGMRAQLNAISSTCISCHSRYRDFAGELNTQRAGAHLPGESLVLSGRGRVSGE
jgi:hypothetical protein